MVMQSMLIWMVLAAEPGAAPTEWMADLKRRPRSGFDSGSQHRVRLCGSTYWSSISNSWLNTSWLKKSAVCMDWFWEDPLSPELSLILQEHINVRVHVGHEQEAALQFHVGALTTQLVQEEEEESRRALPL